MKRLGILLAALMVNLAGVSGASATPYDLAQWATNRDGVVINTFLDPNENFSSWSWTLGFSGAGSHKAIVFVDPEIDQGTNSWFNEYGSTGGTLAAGPTAWQTWEIDEPGVYFGDIYKNVLAGTLDNANAINPGDYPYGEDVSMALGWDFTLAAGQTASATFRLTSDAGVCSNGFYLSQSDTGTLEGTVLGTEDKLYFCSTLNIRDGGGGTAPEPSSLALLALAVAGMAAVRRKVSAG